MAWSHKCIYRIIVQILAHYLELHEYAPFFQRSDVERMVRRKMLWENMCCWLRKNVGRFIWLCLYWKESILLYEINFSFARRQTRDGNQSDFNKNIIRIQSSVMMPLLLPWNKCKSSVRSTLKVQHALSSQCMLVLKNSRNMTEMRIWLL